MAVTPDDIARVTGQAKPEREAPRSRVEQASNEIDDANARMQDLAERERRPGESREGAYTRLLLDHPDLYSGLKRSAAKALRKAGIGDDAATGGI